MARRVQPVLVSLRSDLSSTQLAKDAATRLAPDIKVLVHGAAGVGVFFGVGSFADLAQWSTAAATTAGGFAIQSAAESARAAAGSRKAAKTHDLYCLLAANDHLR